MVLTGNTLFQTQEVAVAIMEQIYSLPASAFIPIDNSNLVVYGTTGAVSGAANVSFKAAVSLPHGASILSAVVRGTANDPATETWQLLARTVEHATFATILSGTLGTVAIGVTAPIVDNSLYIYEFFVNGLDAGELIKSATITYIRDIKFGV